MRNLLRSTLPILLTALAVGCGSGDSLTGNDTTSLEELPFSLEQNVKTSLTYHFSGSTKPPAGWNPVIYFDYTELGREFVNSDKALVTGQFIFSLGSQAPKKGTLKTYFTRLNGRWVAGAPFEVSEGAVSSIQVTTQIRDQISAEPVEGATVVAHRPGDDPRSSLPAKSDAQGIALLEVFQGRFELLVNHPGFRGVVIPEFIHANRILARFR